MTAGTIDKFVRDVASALSRKDLREANKELASMLVHVLRRLEKIEARPQLRYRGHWADGQTFAPNDIAYLGGSAWISLTHTSEKPSTKSPDWEIFTKSGRDGRDGKDLRDDANARRTRAVTAHRDDPDSRVLA